MSGATKNNLVEFESHMSFLFKIAPVKEYKAINYTKNTFKHFPTVY